MKTHPDEVYANGSIIREHLYGIPPEVLIRYDSSTHLTITNFGALEWQMGGLPNRVTLTKGNHPPRTICEFKLVAPDPGENMYKFEIHPSHNPSKEGKHRGYHIPKGEYPIIKTRSLVDLDLVIGFFLSNGDDNLAKKARSTGIILDTNVKKFIAYTKTDARSHRHPHNC